MSDIFSERVRNRIGSGEVEPEIIEPDDPTGVTAFDVQDPDMMCDALLELAARVTKLEKEVGRRQNNEKTNYIDRSKTK